MKRLLILSLTFVICHLGYAQKTVYEDIEFGLRAGINVTGLHGNFRDSLNTKYKVGVHFGVYTKYYITDKFKASFELLVTRKGFKADIFDTLTFGTFIYSQNLYQLEVPILIEYTVSKLSSFELGASYSITFYNDKVNFPGISPFLEDAKDISVFVGYNYFIDELTTLGFRYNYGLNPIIETSTQKGYSSSFQVLIRTRLL